ncbi:hypothetical protein ALC152_05240 [Arcobacter sp. 15-2]|uniref:hypothetical protein n=1 Tax=Arcobacter sp. 15-2 TaxID=3374109 RepID=UPI00399D52A0
MKNNTIANTSLTLLFMFIIYVSILLTSNTYNAQTLMVFGLISVLGIIIFTSSFVYFKFILKDELFTKEQANEDEIKHFFEDKKEEFTSEIVNTEPVESVPVQTETKPEENNKKRPANILTEDPADALAKALAAIHSVNQNDSDIKREF